MLKLDYIPIPEFDMHDELGTLGDSDEITWDILNTYDIQLRQYQLELCVFENGAALNWFVKRR